ncbi:MAG: hypothetical protein JNM82_14280 [Rhodocyclaceae bacterium]|nr:hypothetical protein [Rhodocyclaceae bacterium]
MFEFLKHLFPTDGDPVPGGDRRLVEVAIEALVDRTDPRLRALSDYRQRLAPAVEEAILHTRLVVARLQPPVELTRRAFAADPLVHLLFATAESIGEIAGRDPNVREFLASPRHAGSATLFALLLAERREKTVFGHGLEGGILVRDIPQTMISFTRHRLHAVAGSEAHALSLTGRIVFRQLIRHSLEHMRARRRSIAAAAGTAMEEAPAVRPETHDDPFSRRPPAEDRSGRFAADAIADRKVRPPPTLEDYLDDAVAVMEAPARHLNHRQRTVKVDRMGIVRPSRNAAGDFDTITYWEATPDTGIGPMATVLVRIPVGEIATDPLFPGDPVF